nr:hypothetical protein [Tanacetum cinerariifolium]
MVLTFADTHNMIAYLTKSDASKGFNQIIDFSNEISIKYPLTVNPNIYVSCIKQFWSSVSVKKVSDVTRLQALVDKKRVIITEATIRDALRLADAERIDCLPNEEIFTELARMGYEKPFTKLTFYKAFFSINVDVVPTAVDEPSIPSPTPPTQTPPPSQDIPSTSQKVFANMRRVGKGCSGVETPLFEGMLVAQQVDESVAELNDDDVPAAGVADDGAVEVNVDAVPAAVDEPSIPSPPPPTQPPPPSQDILSTSQVQPTPPPSPIAQPTSPKQQPQPSQDADISMDLLHNLLDTYTTLTRRVEHLEQNKIAQALEITKLKQRVKKLERRNKLKVSKLRRLKRVGTSQRDTEMSMDLLHNLFDTCTTLTRRVENLEHDKIAQALEITKLKQRVKKLERRNKLKVSKLRRLKRVGTSQRVEISDDTIMDDVSKQMRIIADMDANVDVTLKDIAKDVVVDAEIKESADVQGRQAESQAKIYQINLEHANKVLSMQEDEVEPSELQEVVEVVTTAKLITEVVTAASTIITAAAPQITTVAAPTFTIAPSAARRRKGVVIRDPK